MNKLLYTLKIQIETGREQQIRQHMSQAGFPIVGECLLDLASEHADDLQLKATELALVLPLAHYDIAVSCDSTKRTLG